MENVMTNGFCELNEQEMMETNGGIAPLVAALIIAASAVPVAIDVGCFVVGTVNYAEAAIKNYRSVY